MGEKTIVREEDIERIQEERSAINRLKLEDIVFTRDGVPVEYTAEEIQEWRYSGLNNMDFILCGPFRDDDRNEDDAI